ncbi:hypothetical protein E3N88_41949 [Mikania micrantha]|uniref:Uncharacterized protein n=1 Tax=Mikania micrantha TaxID=192012 RepID=A0A5N6LJD5_9ASTR|nr:hypothetical protein E3N88_41949 [Mikania micrantha]
MKLACRGHADQNFNINQPTSFQSNSFPFSPSSHSLLRPNPPENKLKPLLTPLEAIVGDWKPLEHQREFLEATNKQDDHTPAFIRASRTCHTHGFKLLRFDDDLDKLAIKGNFYVQSWICDNLDMLDMSNVVKCVLKCLEPWDI